VAFRHDVAGGNGALVVTQLRSPNYDPGAGTGWTINKDGSATFYSITLPDFPAGVKVTFSSTEPRSPDVGDLWYDVSDGLLLSQWSGTAWVPHQIGTGAISDSAITTSLIADNAITTALIASGAVTETEIAAGTITAAQINSAAGILGGMIASGTITGTNIAAGTITAGLLAAGIVVAGIVDATTISAATFTGSVFEGTDFILNTAGEFFYSPAIGTGNLAFSIAAVSGTDPNSGQTYGKGIYAHGGGAAVGMAISGGIPVLDLSAAGRTHATLDAEIFPLATNAGSANELAWLVLTSGKESSHDDAAIQLVSESADATIPAKIVFEFGGAIAVTLTSTGFTVENWIAGVLGNGWVNAGSGSVVFQYRKVASPPNSVEVIGEINGAAATSSVFFQLPSGYRPASNQLVPAGSTTTSQTAWVECDNAGKLSLIATSFVNKYYFHGTISLDA